MSKIRLNEDMIGKEVRLVKIINDYNPNKIGATGCIVDYDKTDENNMHYLVNWDFNGHEWETWPNDEEIEEVVKNKDAKSDKKMTDEEIWEMLRPKLVKNGLDWIHYGYDADGNKFYYFDETALKNAVAIAYKSGYYRSQKGRPFKFGEKKKKGGHWESVDPNNLPKEGTKIKYNRESYIYRKYNNYIELNDKGIFKKIKGEPGILLDNPHKFKWVCFKGTEKCFEMWVEDDE